MIITGQQNENQRTTEWIKSRMGRFSCSQLHRLMTDPKATTKIKYYLHDIEITEKLFMKNIDDGKYDGLSSIKETVKPESGKLSDGAITYVMECIAEKLTGKPAKDDFSSKYTDWGVQHEPIAIAIYEEVFGCKVTQSGYISYGENFGGSPDGLIGEAGGIEIKCPYTITAHLIHSITQDLKADYKECYWQIIGYLIITGREWFDFVSYHPEYPGKYQFKRIRIIRANVLADLEQAQIKIKQSTEYLNLILNSI